VLLQWPVFLPIDSWFVLSAPPFLALILTCAVLELALILVAARSEYRPAAGLFALMIFPWEILPSVFGPQTPLPLDLILVPHNIS
jgi:hypothetical protein